MKENNLIQGKSFEFAIRIVKAYQYLRTNKKEFVLCKQLLKCGTSIGANVEEAIGAQSKADFIAKLSISHKEARETKYWIRLLYATGYLTKRMSDSLIEDTNVLIRIIAKILITSKSRS